MADRPKVYVLNDSGHDLNDLKRFGEVVIYSKGLMPKFKVTAMKRNFEEFFADSKPTDFIVQLGPTMMFAMFCIVFTMKHHKINWLILGIDRYIKRTVVFGD